MTFELNHDDAIHLDAEALAEGGIASAYKSLIPALNQFVKNPASIQEDRDDDTPSYSVRCGNMAFAIYGPDVPRDSWGRATVAFFSIVNAQLVDSSQRFFAINGGNDLFGLFLSPTQAMEARESLPNKMDWPYIPRDEEPYNGQFH